MSHHSPDTFTIRPHHLGDFYALMQNYVEYGEEVLEIERRDYSRNVGNGIEMLDTPLPALNVLRRVQTIKARKYIVDVHGSTEKSATTHINAQMKINEEFLYGDGSTPVRIALEKDRVCLETCAIGTHCDTMVAKHELPYIDQFSGMAEEAGLTIAAHDSAIDTDLATVKCALTFHILQQREAALAAAA